MSLITTHVLDTSKGKPAQGIEVRLLRLESENNWQELGCSRTDADGRVSDLLRGKLLAGTYQLSFATGSYLGESSFYPYISVVFRVADTNQHYHVPILLSPYGFSTYRGS